MTPGETEKKIFWRKALQLTGLSLLLCFAVEALSRHSLAGAAFFALGTPHAFLYNALILLSTLAGATLLHRRIFAVTLVSTLWTLLGIVNFIMGIVRITPLGFYDFVIWLKNTSISNAYVSIGQFVLIGLGILAVAAAMVTVFRRARRETPQRRRGLLFVLLVWGLTAACSVPYSMLCRDYADPAKAYKRYGFPYSLLRSAVDRGVSRPDTYNMETISDIVTDVQATPAAPSKAAAQPNFIFLQLESFLSTDNFTSVTLSEDPTPTFTRLKRECSTGWLNVPMIGGGTANVEFEVITGMNLSDFGTGEYPYSTVLQEAVCESVAYDLKELGYAAHAIHSNTATFYQRYLVFPRLGFDTFTSIEYMQDYTVNSLGWCEDKSLIAPIMDCLTADESPDVIFTVSVQGHGMYSTDPPKTPYAITSAGLEENEGLKNAFEYYVSQLKATDDFLEELMRELSDYPEPVVLVIYGDHLPALDFSEEQLRSGSLLTTEYVIWSNDGSLKKQDQDLTSYQLTAYTMERCGISSGVLMRFHQQRRNDPDYLENLHRLEYDVLYGDQYLYDGQLPYEPTLMRMGVREIRMESAVYDGKALIVRGENFTRFSVICMDEHELDTVFVDSGTLVALPGLLDKIVESDGVVSVAQVAQDGTVLSRVGSIPCEI